jgi:uncharacterized damage-inducible protein DinB
MSAAVDSVIQMSEGFGDPRVDPPSVGTEREMLESWLDFHRTTLLIKCQGLDVEQLSRRPVPSSLLSLHGLVRHMTNVERNWFQRAFGGSPSPPTVLENEQNRDAEWTSLESANWDADLALWEAECERSRQMASSHSLDDAGTAVRGGLRSSFPLRWIYLHMIEEYARHNGHADLIRELVDGSVGV